MVNTSKGFAFTYQNIDFYHGLYSEGSYAAFVEEAGLHGTLVYLSAVECKMLGREKVAHKHLAVLNRVYNLGNSVKGEL